MILTHSDYVQRLADSGSAGFDLDMAQTVASWWYSPGAPALVTLTCQGRVIPGLVEEVERELAEAKHASAADKDDLRLLAEWARGELGEITPAREARARAELIARLDEMTRKAGE